MIAFAVGDRVEVFGPCGSGFGVVVSLHDDADTTRPLVRLDANGSLHEYHPDYLRLIERQPSVSGTGETP